MLLLPLVVLINTASGTRVQKLIYFDVTGTSACFRRFNGTHQIGCTSDLTGNVGVVHYIENKSDLDWVLEAGPHQPYALLMEPEHFNRTNVIAIKQSGKVNGIMVINKENSTLPSSFHFSPDQSCPNNVNGLYDKHSQYADCSNVTWNTAGNGLMFMDFGMPIFSVQNETEIDYIIHKCFAAFNKPINGTPREHPLCAAQLKDFMTGAKDSHTCLSRTKRIININPETYCDPLGDQNVYGLLKPVANNESLPQKSIIMATARLDSFGLFEAQYAELESPVVSFITLLAAAEAIGRVKQDIVEDKNAKDIMFTFFQGESLDYIGSGRMVYDIETSVFPQNKDKYGIHVMNFSHIAHFVEVGQVGLAEGGAYYLHSDPVSQRDGQVAKEVTKLKSNFQEAVASMNKTNLTIEGTAVPQPLPPASFQSFLKKANISGVVLADHEREFKNRFYNSRLDTLKGQGMDWPSDRPENFNTTIQLSRDIQILATALARSLYIMATNSTQNISRINAALDEINHMLYCFLKNPKCALFKKVLEPKYVEQLAETPQPFYVGVKRANTQNQVTHWVRQLLAYYTGDRLNSSYTSSNCSSSSKLYNYYWISHPPDGMCIRTTANFSEAESPAFLDENFDTYDWSSGQYSTWTESSWAGDAMQVRIFLTPSQHMSNLTFATGVALMVVAMIVTYFINSRADFLFTKPDSF
ncbi:nicastrin-like [Lingula anatina]|uniref:Nicastrin n=1 Tax=Lingula anatina TaxID=7574 RepID=A0A1S3HK06_LINAN|nr:nicastrin-like [Lingula anatina]|eukprot:XP_013386352.1 nicastrin-like [Lingula anatina]